MPKDATPLESRKDDGPIWWRGPRSRRPATAFAAALSVAFLLLGCDAPDTSEQPTGDAYDHETEIFEEIRRLDFGAVVGAYTALAETPHRVRVTSTQQDRDGRLIASEIKVVRLGPEGVAVEDVTAEGRMSTGFMQFAVAGDSIPDLGTDVADLWTPGEPAFTSPRNRDYYRYGGPRDTLLAGERCLTYEATAIAGISADRMPIRSARVYVAVSDSSILGLRIERQDDAIFYHERSSLVMTLRRATEHGLLPLRRKVSVEVKAPLRNPHYFAITQEYIEDSASGSGND